MDRYRYFNVFLIFAVNADLLARMPILQTELICQTRGRGTQEVTELLAKQVRQWCSKHNVSMALLNVFIQHTSAGLLITENADAGVRRDLERWLADAVPDGDARFEHDYEGEDDMPAHIRTILTESSLTVPVQNGQLAMGTWQGVYLYEHRYASHQRRIVLTLQY